MFVPAGITFSDIIAPYVSFSNPQLFVASYDGTGNNIALVIDDEGMKEKLSVNVDAYYTEIPRNVVAVKNYSEHEGLAAALEVAGIAKIVSEIQIGFGKGYFMELSFDAATLYENAVKGLK